MRMGNLLIYSAADNFCIWPRELPRCRLSRASLGRKLIRHGRYTGAIDSTPGAARPHDSSTRGVGVLKVLNFVRIETRAPAQITGDSAGNNRLQCRQTLDPPAIPIGH